MRNYDEAKEWMVAKAAQYGGMYAFQCSEEYKGMYPTLKRLYEAYKQEQRIASKQAMEEAGVMEGDTVERHVPGLFITADEVWCGCVVLKDGIPKVKVQRGAKTMEVGWNKAWKKLNK